jgi:hypothetical protein
LQNYGFIRNSPPGWGTPGWGTPEWGMRNLCKQVKEIIMMQCIACVLYFALHHEPEGAAVFRDMRVLHSDFARALRTAGVWLFSLHVWSGAVWILWWQRVCIHGTVYGHV